MNDPKHRQRIMKSGWLRKQGGMVRTWHRRWFCLNGDCLFYFAKEDDLKPVGSLFLPGNRVSEIQWTPDDSDKYLFEICPGKIPNQDMYLLCANNSEERQDWLKAIRKVIYSDIGGAIFGQSIEETMSYEHSCKLRDIPYIVEQCVEFITEYGLDVEGIFRLPGRTTLVKELKDRFDCAEKIIFDISEHDVHSVASLLKMYFRELPQYIIPSSYYQVFMNIALNFQEAKEANQKKESVAKAAKTMVDIPDDNYSIVRYLCQFLRKVGAKSDVNKMTIINLATVFGPNMIRNKYEADSPELLMATANLTQQLAFILINYYDEIFIERKKEEDKIEETKPEVPVENLLDLTDQSEVLDRPKPLPVLRDSIQDRITGSRGSSLLTSVTEELLKKSECILQPTSLSVQSSNQSDVLNKDNDNNCKNNNELPEPKVERRRPIPPARKNKTKSNEDKVSSVYYSRTNSTDSHDAKVIHNLRIEVENLKTQLENTREEYEKKIQQLKTSYNSKINVLRTNSSNAEKIYKEKIVKKSDQMEKIQNDLEREKQDRNEAVEKVMKLQTELNRYHLQYGQFHG